MESFSPDDVISFLREHCTDVDVETIDIIKKEKISGKRAMKLALQDWRNVGMSYGEAVDISGAIQMLLNGDIQFSCNRDNAVSDKENEVVQSVADADQVSITTKNSSIESYFTPKQFNELGEYDKENYRKQLQIYEEAQAKGKVFPMPQFMKTMSKPARQSQVLTSSQVPNRSIIVPPLTVTTRQRATMGQQLMPPNVSDISQVNSGASCSKSLHSGDTSTSSSLPLRNSVPSCSQNINTQKKKSKSVESQRPEPVFNDFDTDTESSHESEPAEKEQATKKRRRKRRNKPDDDLSEEAFLEKLPQFDIIDILSKAGKKLKPVLKDLNANGTVYGKARKLLMRTLTKYLYFKHVSDIKLVTTDMKNGMAASLVGVFPLFKDTTDPNKRSWWRIFNPSGPSGFIANCSAGILRSLDSKDRPRGGGQGSSYYSEESEDNDNDDNAPVEHPDAEWMRLTMPWNGNKNKLIQGMETSYETRRKWICKQEPTVTEILSVYPHLMSFDCELLDKEFSMIFPNRGHLFTKGFPHLVQSLKNSNELREVDGLDNGENTDILGACLCLGEKLPRPNLKKKSQKKSTGAAESVMPTLPSLLHMVPVGTNVQEVVDARRMEANAPVQPYLLAFARQREVSKLFIVADSQIIQMPSGSVLQGLDMLFKAYHVFNVMYPLGWSPFWHMVEHGLYQIDPSKLTNSALEILKQHNIVK